MHFSRETLPAGCRLPSINTVTGASFVFALFSVPHRCSADILLHDTRINLLSFKVLCRIRVQLVSLILVDGAMGIKALTLAAALAACHAVPLPGSAPQDYASGQEVRAVVLMVTT